MFAGRTGRFGRKGISINFVHDKRTWQQMEQIEQATGKQIIRIETNDLDEMEEVRRAPSRGDSQRNANRRAWTAANEEGPQVIAVPRAAQSRVGAHPRPLLRVRGVVTAPPCISTRDNAISPHEILCALAEVRGWPGCVR